jgi:hypothetical protein
MSSYLYLVVCQATLTHDWLVVRDGGVAFLVRGTMVGVATGLDFPDALSGRALLAKEGAPLLLATSTVLPTATSTYLRSTKSTITTTQVFGDTAVVPDSLVTAIEAALL